MFRKISLDEAQTLPVWRRPVALLFLMALGMPIAFNTWSALLNNFVIEVAGLMGPISGFCTRFVRYRGFSPLVSSRFFL